MKGIESQVWHRYRDLRIFLSRMVKKIYWPMNGGSVPEWKKGSLRARRGMKKAPFLPQCGEDGACQVHHPVVPMLHAVAWE